MYSEISYPKTIFAFVTLILIFVPVSLIAELLMRLLIGMSSSYTMGASDNIIPFDFLPQYGVPIMNFLKELGINFVRTIGPLWVVSFLFRKSFHKINWILVSISFYLFTIFIFVNFVPNISEMPSLLVYATLIMVGIFILISYLILFHKKTEHIS